MCIYMHTYVYSIMCIMFSMSVMHIMSSIDVVSYEDLTHVMFTPPTPPPQVTDVIPYDKNRPRENMVGVNMVLAEYHQNTLT